MVKRASCSIHGFGEATLEHRTVNSAICVRFISGQNVFPAAFSAVFSPMASMPLKETTLPSATSMVMDMPMQGLRIVASWGAAASLSGPPNVRFRG